MRDGRRFGTRGVRISAVAEVSNVATCAACALRYARSPRQSPAEPCSGPAVASKQCVGCDLITRGHLNNRSISIEELVISPANGLSVSTVAYSLHAVLLAVSCLFCRGCCKTPSVLFACGRMAIENVLRLIISNINIIILTINNSNHPVVCITGVVRVKHPCAMVNACYRDPITRKLSQTNTDATCLHGVASLHPTTSSSRTRLRG